MALYNTPYDNPNEIKVIPRGYENNNNNNFIITRYNWDNPDLNFSPYKDSINALFIHLDVRDRETICLYMQWTRLPHIVDGLGVTWDMDDVIVENLYKECLVKVERIKVEESNKWFNPLTDHLDYKLGDGTYVQTQEEVSPLTQYDIKVDILSVINDEQFVMQCMPVERRQKILDSVLGD